MKLTKEQKTEITELFKNGKSLRSIAKQFGTNIQRVRLSCIEELGEEGYQIVADNHRNLTTKQACKTDRFTREAVKDRNERVIADYKNGSSIAGLAVKYGINFRTVFKIIAKRLGGKPRIDAKVRTLDKNYMEIAKMISAGSSIGKIARRFGVTYGSVYFWAQRNVPLELLKNNLGINGRTK